MEPMGVLLLVLGIMVLGGTSIILCGCVFCQPPAQQPAVVATPPLYALVEVPLTTVLEDDDATTVNF